MVAGRHDGLAQRPGGYTGQRPRTERQTRMIGEAFADC